MKVYIPVIKAVVLVFWSLLGLANLYGQEANLPPVIKDKIPAGWRQHTLAAGDLNQDGKQDLVLFLENTDSTNFLANKRGMGTDTLNLNPRRLMIFFKEADGYRQLLSTDQFLLKPNDSANICLADPLEEGSVVIKNGVLRIDLHYWLSCGSWYVTNYSYTFRYQADRFELIGLDCHFFHRASGAEEITSINFMTCKKQIITGRNAFEDNENQPVEKWESYPVKKRYQLAEMTHETVLKLF